MCDMQASEDNMTVSGKIWWRTRKSGMGHERWPSVQQAVKFQALRIALSLHMTGVMRNALA